MVASSVAEQVGREQFGRALMEVSRLVTEQGTVWEREREREHFGRLLFGGEQLGRYQFGRAVSGRAQFGRDQHGRA